MIEFSCPTCARDFQADPAHGGSQWTCPSCHVTSMIPSGNQPAKPAVARAVQPAARSASPKPTAPQWYVHTPEGNEYGPISQRDLKQWVEDDRLDGDCQVLKDGWESWKYASEVFPSLAETESSSDPFDFSQGSSGRSSSSYSSNSYGSSGYSQSSYRRNSQWSWSYSYWTGLWYGPVPVGWIFAAIVGVIFLAAKSAKGP